MCIVEKNKDGLEWENCACVGETNYNILRGLGRPGVSCSAFSVIFDFSDFQGKYVTLEITDASTRALSSFLGRGRALN